LQNIIMTRKQDTDFGINRNTTAMAGVVVVALAVAVAVAIADLLTETVTSEAVPQKAKREQRDQVSKQFDHGFCAAGSRANLLSRIGATIWASGLLRYKNNTYWAWVRIPQ
jgi:hypothetical protein